MKVLVIADIHGRKFWRQAIANNIGQVDKIIFLGDYLDPYPQEIIDNPDSMECKYFNDSKNLLAMLEDIVSLKRNEPNKYILLTGNHTDSYIWSKFHAATRTDYDNWEKYHKFFSHNLNLFNFVWKEDDVIFSHAGIVKGWVEEFFKKEPLILDDSKTIIETFALAFHGFTPKDVNIEFVNVLGHISHYRRGDYLYGSCEWADIQEHLDMKNSSMKTLVPLGEKGIYQVFGHTCLKRPIITEKWACLDCKQGFIFDTITHACNSCL